MEASTDASLAFMTLLRTPYTLMQEMSRLSESGMQVGDRALSNPGPRALAGRLHSL